MSQKRKIPDVIPSQQERWNDEYRVKGKLWARTSPEPTSDTGEGIFLDLGCGNGKNLRQGKQGRSIRVGLDFSLYALKLCKNEPEFSDVSFICADIRYLPFNTSSVHAIDAHHIMGHLLSAERTKAAQEITRVLESDGELTITVFGEEDFRKGSGGEIEPETYLRGNEIVTHYFSSEEISNLFPNLLIDIQNTHTWQMRIKGKQLLRMVRVARFKKI